MSRIRSIHDAHKIIKESDHDTAVTEYMIRKLVTDGDIPSFKSGSKRLVDVDTVITYFYGTGGDDA